MSRQGIARDGHTGVVPFPWRVIDQVDTAQNDPGPRVDTVGSDYRSGRSEEDDSAVSGIVYDLRISSEPVQYARHHITHIVLHCRVLACQADPIRSWSAERCFQFQNSIVLVIPLLSAWSLISSVRRPLKTLRTSIIHTISLLRTVPRLHCLSSPSRK